MVDNDEDRWVWIVGLASGLGEFAAQVRAADLIDRPPSMQLLRPTLIQFKPAANGVITMRAEPYPAAVMAKLTGDTREDPWIINGHSIVLYHLVATPEAVDALSKAWPSKIIQATSMDVSRGPAAR